MKEELMKRMNVHEHRERCVIILKKIVLSGRKSHRSVRCFDRSLCQLEDFQIAKFILHAHNIGYIMCEERPFRWAVNKRILSENSEAKMRMTKDHPSRLCK